MALEVYWFVGTADERWSSPLLPLFEKRYPFAAGLKERVFQSSEGEARV